MDGQNPRSWGQEASSNRPSTSKLFSVRKHAGGMLAARLFSKIKIQNLEEVAQLYNKVHSIHSLLQIWENYLLFSKAKKGAKVRDQNQDGRSREDGEQRQTSKITSRLTMCQSCHSSLLAQIVPKSPLDNFNRRSGRGKGDDEDDGERDRLKMELARERMKNKRIKLCGLMEVILQVMTVLSISTFLLVIVLMQG
uniref:Uncharacterized protein n=1 Tax=Salix viminalis TaxID=40686 RepID=A0A6N2MLM2_SALVM